MGTILITGASAGIGEALARKFHSQHHQVVCLARRKERIETLAQELNRLRPNSALAIQCDVNDSENLNSAINQSLSHFKSIDGFIANAGFGIAGNAEILQLTDYRRQFETNVFSVVQSFLLVKNALIESKGFFTVIGSVNSYLSLPTASAYAMSKFAVRAFCDAIYWELKPRNVSVTFACPGFIDTEIRKVNNLGEFKKESKDPIPNWLMLSSEKAAAQIYKASMKRKKEVIITFHGKILVLISRFMPWILNPLMKRLIKNRNHWNESGL